MPPIEIPRAILFLDVYGSVGLYRRMGDHAAYEAICRALNEADAAVTSHGGSVLKRLGDGLLAGFPGCTEAVLACEAIRQRSEGVGRLSEAILFRFAVHWGSVLLDDGDMFGDSVNVAARVLGLTRPNEILVTCEAQQRCSLAPSQQWVAIQAAHLAGRDAGIQLFTLLGSDDCGQTEAGAPLASRREDALVLDGPGVHRRLGADGGSISIGREKTNDVVIDEPCVSRRHATIQWEADRFVFRDHSHNGSYISLAQGTPQLVQRERVALLGKGTILLGGSHERAPRLSFSIGTEIEESPGRVG